VAAKQLDRFDTIRRLRDQEHVRLGRDDRGEPLTEDRMVLDAKMRMRRA
jgi:hypothetical protein